MSKYTLLPDYKNCIANLPNSILKYFGCGTAGDTLPAFDKYLDKKYKNIIVLVLDGMGSSVLCRGLDNSHLLRRHYKESITSVLPSATVAATTSLMTGLQPCEHAWLGWNNYYKDIDKNVTVFRNRIQDTGKKAAPYNVAFTLTPYKSVVERLNEAGINAYTVSPFVQKELKSLQDVLDKTKELCAESGRKYIYAYWPSPDDLLHKHGGGSSESEKVKEFLEDAERRILDFTYDMKNSLLVVTADHGHTDVKLTYLSDHPELLDCLERLPSLEARTMTFFVKKGRKREFKKLFKEIYGDDFMLLSKKEILEKQLFGTGAYHPKFMSMLGDYFAVATGDISIMTGGIRNWLSDHGGATEEEMRVPLIVLNDFFPLGTDVNAYVKEALRRLKKKYPWAKRSMFNKHESYAIEEVSGKKEFVNYYTWDDNTGKRYAEGWDGELFIRRIISEQESHITGANKVKEVLDVMPDYGVDCHGWCLERFEFRSHVLGGYSAFVQAGDRVAGGSREFFFAPEQMNGTFEEFLDANRELLSGAFGLNKEYMEKFKGLREFLGFKE